MEGLSDERSGQASPHHPPDPGPRARWSDDLRRQGSGYQVSAHRAAAPARGRAQCADRPPRRCRLCILKRLRRPDRHADRRAARRQRPEVQPLSYDGAVLADPPGAVDRAQSPLRQHGWHLRDRDLGARLQFGPAEEQGAARDDAQAERLFDGAVRQMSRGAGVGDEPDGTVRPVADRRRRLRIFLRLHRRRDQPVLPRDL